MISNDYKEMQQALPNLMNSLRNIWMLSKHYNTDEQICGQKNVQNFENLFERKSPVQYFYNPKDPNCKIYKFAKNLKNL